MMAREAMTFTGEIYDRLFPHAEKVKVAHALMLRTIAAAKRKNDRIDSRKMTDCRAATCCRSAIWPSHHSLRFSFWPTRIGKTNLS